MGDGILHRIVTSKREEIAALQAGQFVLKRDMSRTGCFSRALSSPGLSVIAEIKRRSPSLGDIHPEADAGAVARAYTEAGASAISVLTDGPFFGGSLDDIRRVREVTSLPVLCKDFIIDEAQLAAAAEAGADAALLIVRLLNERKLAELLLAADSLGLDVLVETHNADEIRTALRAGATIVGVNCRDLDTLDLNVHHHIDMAARLPSTVIKVAESGIHQPADLRHRRQAGYDAVLVGTRLMKSADPGPALEQLLAHESLTETAACS